MIHLSSLRKVRYFLHVQSATRMLCWTLSVQQEAVHVTGDCFRRCSLGGLCNNFLVNTSILFRFSDVIVS